MSDKNSSTKKADGDKSSADKKESSSNAPKIGMSTTPMSNIRSGPGKDGSVNRPQGGGSNNGPDITESALAVHAEIDTGIGCSEMAYYNALMKGGRVTRHRIRKEEDPVVGPSTGA